MSKLIKYGWKIKPNEEQVALLQDWHAEKHLDRFFSKVYGDSILIELEKIQDIRDKTIVDYGAGPGFMTSRLINRGGNVYAVDISPESLGVLKRNNPGIKDAVLSRNGEAGLSSDFADVVILLETIEHLDDQLIGVILKDIYRILKPGGLLFISCPNEEDLEASLVCCPNCGGAFHPVLHERTFSGESLCSTVKEYGFKMVKAVATSWSLSRWPRALVCALYKMTGKKLPHLYCVAIK